MEAASEGRTLATWSASAVLTGIFFALVLTLSGEANAHGGGLNSEGCHNDRRNGGYHCHRGGASSRSSRDRLQPVQPRALASTPTGNADLVRAAQTLLNHLGCDAGAVDGGAGAATRAAIDRFNQAAAQPGASTDVDAGLMLRLSRAVSDDVRCIP